MIENFECSGYRGLGNFKLQNPSRFNLIVGPNNCGKTSALEAIYINCNVKIKESFEKVLRIRLGKDFPFTNDVLLESFERVKWLFEKNYQRIEMKCNFEKSTTTLDIVLDESKRDGNIAHIEAEYDRDGGIYHSTLSFSANGGGGFIPYNPDVKEFPVLYLHPYTHKSYNPTDAYSRASKVGRKKFLLSKLQELDQDITDMDIVFEDDSKNKPLLHLKHNKLVSTPIYNFGDGLQKSFEFATRLSEYKNGIILIDEFESSLHPVAMRDIAAWFLDLIEEKEINVQVFATTHSVEFIDALIGALDPRDERVVLYRLAKTKNGVRTKRFGTEELRFAREEIGTDLRIVE